jgi:phosphoribosylanthranilate isomerase
MVWVKICGVTSVADALGCVEAGADAIGINFYAGSPRFCDLQRAREITDAVGSRIEVVGVFVDASREQIDFLRNAVGFGHAQLHGLESPGFLQSLLPRAYKALRVMGDRAIEEAGRYGGDRILLDAYVPGVAGGTGACFDWAVAKRIAGQRRVIVAGGLTPDNVAEAITEVAPYGVDTASGVESAPGQKDLVRLRAFVQTAKLSGPRALPNDFGSTGGPFLR